jgi:hypothetical protein
VYFQVAYLNWLLALGLVDKERIILGLSLSTIDLACSIQGRFHNYMHGNTPRLDAGVVSRCLERCVCSEVVRARHMHRSKRYVCHWWRMLYLRVLSLPSHAPLIKSCSMHAFYWGGGRMHNYGNTARLNACVVSQFVERCLGVCAVVWYVHRSLALRMSLVAWVVSLPPHTLCTSLCFRC